MRRDTRLARLLHILIHMHLRGGRTTSETIALMLHTNPVVVRRTMARLRDHGYVSSEGGHGGGWNLRRKLETITVLDVHRALGAPALLAIEVAKDHPSCPVETAVNSHLEKGLEEAEKLLLQRFGHLSLADIAADVARRKSARRS